MSRFAKPTVTMTAAILLFYSATSTAYDLIDVHHLALDNDPVLRAADAARQAEIEIKPQNRALLLPLISFDADYRQGRERIRNNAFDPSLNGTEDRFSASVYSLSLLQPLYNREYFVRLGQADASVARAEAEYRSAEQDLMVRVARAYLELLASRDNLDFERAEKEAIERQLEQAKQRFEVGLVAITDVHEAQAAFDLTTATEIEAVNRLQSSEEALYEITGELPGQVTALRAEIPLALPDPADIDQWVATAMQENFALRAAQFSETIAEEDISVQRSGHHPRLDLVASINRTDSDSGALGGERGSDDAIIGLTFSLPLYSGNAVTSRSREAGFRLTQAKEEVERQRRATLRQTRDAYLAVIAAINRVKALSQARVSAQSALEATEAGLEVGTRTTVDVLLARSDLFDAERGYARARYEYIINILLLKQAAGVLTVQDLEQINLWLEG